MTSYIYSSWSLNPGSVCIRSFPNVTGYCPVCPEGHLMGTTHPRALVLNNIFLNIKHHSQSLIEKNLNHLYHYTQNFLNYQKICVDNAKVINKTEGKPMEIGFPCFMQYDSERVQMCSVHSYYSAKFCNY